MTTATAPTFPVVYNRISHAKIVYTWPEEPGIVWSDRYPDIATAQRNLVNYPTRNKQVVHIEPHCQHGRRAGQCTEVRTVASDSIHGSAYWEPSRYIIIGVCVHHPQAAR